MKRCIIQLCLGGLVLGCVVTLVAVAGPLDPPAGPVTPTYKTLTEVEPRIAVSAANTPGDGLALYKINFPGSYYLTGNIVGVSGKAGIVINSINVTLDLSGFVVIGVPGSLAGISDGSTNHGNATILNGSVIGWGGSGVDLNASFDSRVCGLIVTNNGASGMALGDACVARDCLSRDNAHDNITTGFNANLAHCTAIGSVTAHGINVGPDSAVADCVSNFNHQHGIQAATGCTISRASASQNSGVGVPGGAGIDTGSGCTITDCTVFNNARLGIEAADGCTISRCSVTQNAEVGIGVNFGCTVEGCSSRGNGLGGIACNSGCLIRGNSCTDNGTASGILVNLSNNRIEDNNCTSAGRGIDVSGAGNVIVRNTCAGNSVNWFIAANNVVGPILDRRSPGSAAINGNSAPDSTGSTHPNANFTY